MHTHVDEHEIFKIDIKLSAMLLVLCVFPVATFTIGSVVDGACLLLFRLAFIQ